MIAEVTKKAIYINEKRKIEKKRKKKKKGKKKE